MMDVGVLHHVIAGDVEVCDVSNVEWGQRSCNKDITDNKSNKKTQEEAPETIKKKKKKPFLSRQIPLRLHVPSTAL